MKKKNKSLNKAIALVFFILFIGIGFLPSIALGNNNEQDLSSVTFYTFDKTSIKKCTMEISKEVAKKISKSFDELKEKIMSNPTGNDTLSLKNEFVEMLYTNGLITNKLSKEYVKSLLNHPKWSGKTGKYIPSRLFSHTGSSFFCSIAGEGYGILVPPLMFPRPRIAFSWTTVLDAFSAAANLYTGNGFIASGPQFGIALGFMGIGLSFAVPGEPAVFGFGGYALVAFVGADEIETYPPNQVPVITEEQPSDGSVDVPLSISELSFRISDGDGDRMSYSVTTDPDIGSGSDNNVVGGVYSIPVSGLNSNTEYSWHVVVSDAEDINEETFSFRTAKEAPYISDPSPVDGDDWVCVNLSELSFRLEDFQGDLMDFSVETVPDIGSGGGNGVGDGVYTVSVSNLEYTREYLWFVNVTDGEFWTRRVFNFRTQPIMVFDPFEEGWVFRKKITVDHSEVDGDLSGFPVLVSLVDSDLAVKAQVDGDDILFMDGSGVADRLFHEIEFFDGSSGELVAWINVHSLSSVDDTVLYLYYGNPGCSSQQYPEKVWDSGYKAVWHLSEDGSGLRYDSTSNDNDGSPYNFDGDEAVLGQIDGADDFDGSNDHVRTGVSFDYEYRTVSFWFNTDTIPQSSDSKLILSQDSNKLIYGNFKAFLRDGLLYLDAAKDDPFYNCHIQTNTWYAIHLIRDGSQTRIYINGDIKDNGVSGSGGSSSNANINLVIAADRRHRRSFDGTLDEIRISSKARSADWISTEYNNQNDPLSFYIIGPEESGP